MIVGSCEIDLHIPESTSLKEKRRALRPILDRVRKRYNVSIVEVDCHDLWQRARLGVAVVGDSVKSVDSVLNKIIQMISLVDDVEMIDCQVSMY
jgi:uncharacterized protein YlxP (DUF503 family)